MTRVRAIALAATAGVLLVAGGAAGFAETHALRQHSGAAPRASAGSASATPPSPTPSSAPSLFGVLTRAPRASGDGGASTASPDATAPPNPAAVARALRDPLASPALGPRVLAQVVDVATGRVLFARDPDATGAPASTAKVLTAAAVLSVYPPTHRFTTTLVAGSRPGTAVLVGGGDPTLTAAAPGGQGAYPDAARLSTLADDVRTWAGRGHPVRRIVVDDSLFTGPSISPAWAPGDVPSDYGAGITALMVDGGRAAPGDAVRSATPAVAAGHALARLVGRADLPVTRGRAPRGAVVLGRVSSPPLAELVAQTLRPSDNVLAEVLARQVAIAVGRPASFLGAAAATRQVLAGLGVRVGGGMRDGSGLAASDRLAPATLTALLRVIAGPAHPALHDVLAGLPVAAWSGTLADRYLPGSGSAAGAGVVRAKTGTLTGVSALAGVVHDASGRLLAFAFLAEAVPDAGVVGPATDAAEAALDHAAAALAG